jgi:hypothetical protein
VGLYRKHTRSRLGESRRKAKLFYQQILDEMDRERQQLTERCPAHATPEDEEEATCTETRMCVAPSARLISVRSPPPGLGYLTKTQ